MMNESIDRSGSDSSFDSDLLGGHTIFYCVLYIDKYSNRVLESVYSERKNAESYRNRSSQKLHIEPEKVSGYGGQHTLWCSNEWGPGDVLSFLKLHTSYDEAHRVCNSNGIPSPVKILDKSLFHED